MNEKYRGIVTGFSGAGWYNSSKQVNVDTDFNEAASTWDANLYRVERAKVVAEGIRARVPVSAQMSGFEYGCGTGLLSFALQPYLGQIMLADNALGMLAVVDEKIVAGGFGNMRSLILDLERDPLPDLRVGLVYTLMTLHHIPQVEKVLRAFYNLLEVPGYLCVADLDAEDGSFHGPSFDGHKGFAREALGGLARSVGFRKVEFCTIFQTPHARDGQTFFYPMFLMVAEK